MTPHAVAGSPPAASRLNHYPLRPRAAPSSACDAPAHASNPRHASIAHVEADVHEAANRGGVPVVLYIATLLKSGAPPSTPVEPASRPAR